MTSVAIDPHVAAIRQVSPYQWAAKDAFQMPK
jgi:hypothetical protein